MATLNSALSHERPAFRAGLAVQRCWNRVAVSTLCYCLLLEDYTEVDQRGLCPNGVPHGALLPQDAHTGHPRCLYGHAGVHL